MHASNDIARAALGYVSEGHGPDITIRAIALLGVTCDNDGPHRARELSQTLNISKSVITRAVDALGRQGYMVRRRCEIDGRVIYYEPTKEGRAFRAQLATLAA